VIIHPSTEAHHDPRPWCCYAGHQATVFGPDTMVTEESLRLGVGLRFKWTPAPGHKTPSQWQHSRPRRPPRACLPLAVRRRLVRAAPDSELDGDYRAATQCWMATTGRRLGCFPPLAFKFVTSRAATAVAADYTRERIMRGFPAYCSFPRIIIVWRFDDCWVAGRWPGRPLAGTPLLVDCWLATSSPPGR
jgi:hypothetical protein